MIITRTPYRVSFLGGGTDYPAWYRAEGGSVLSTTIDKYCYISCRYLPPFFGIKHRIVWSHIETVSSISEILHPAVREGLRYLNYDDSEGLEVHHQGDLPARSGIGSSSAFSVGLINALSALRDQRLEKHELALKAIELEQEVIGESVGSQDQVAVAYGGLNQILFSRSGQIEVDPIRLSEQRLRDLEQHLMLLYPGTSRISSDVALELIENIDRNSASLVRMRKMVDEGVKVLLGAGNLSEFGELLHESWMFKRALTASVSTPEIDRIYETARAHGATGGKLLGAGAGGFMLLFARPDRQAEIRQSLDQYLFVPFRTESSGSTIIYRDQELGSAREFAGSASGD
jgi:D-glycero-alpha-D-manno-heptose-7-phosphate kinase